MAQKGNLYEGQEMRGQGWSCDLIRRRLSYGPPKGQAPTDHHRHLRIISRATYHRSEDLPGPPLYFIPFSQPLPIDDL